MCGVDVESCRAEVGRWFAVILFSAGFFGSADLAVDHGIGGAGNRLRRFPDCEQRDMREPAVWHRRGDCRGDVFRRFVEFIRSVFCAVACDVLRDGFSAGCKERGVPCGGELALPRFGLSDVGFCFRG